MQKGEQESSCGSSLEDDAASEYSPLSFFPNDASSAHGIMLHDRTRMAMMKARIFFTDANIVLDAVKRKSMFVARGGRFVHSNNFAVTVMSIKAGNETGLEICFLHISQRKKRRKYHYAFPASEGI